MKINIKVKPNSKRQEIKQIKNTIYKISLKQPAQNNKANLELIKLLKKHLKKDIKIIKGFNNKNKIIEVK